MNATSSQTYLTSGLTCKNIMNCASGKSKHLVFLEDCFTKASTQVTGKGPGDGNYTSREKCGIWLSLTGNFQIPTRSRESFTRPIRKGHPSTHQLAKLHKLNRRPKSALEIYTNHRCSQNKQMSNTVGVTEFRTRENLFPHTITHFEY